MEVLKCITAGDVFARTMKQQLKVYGRKELSPENPQLFVIQIAGTIQDYDLEKTDKNTYSRFKGDFVAVCMLTGEQFSSSECILPPSEQNRLLNLLDLEQDKAVEIGGIVYIMYSESSITGYKYGYKSGLKISSTATEVTKKLPPLPESITANWKKKEELQEASHAALDAPRKKQSEKEVKDVMEGRE